MTVAIRPRSQSDYKQPIKKSAVAAHSWEYGHQINDNIKLIKYIILYFLRITMFGKRYTCKKINLI